MKTILRNVDDLFYSIEIADESGQRAMAYDFPEFEIHCFVLGHKACVKLTKEDIGVDNSIRIPADKLAFLPEGELKLRFIIGTDDPGYPDGTYTQTFVKDSGYYLK